MQTCEAKGCFDKALHGYQLQLDRKVHSQPDNVLKFVQNFFSNEKCKFHINILPEAENVCLKRKTDFSSCDNILPNRGVNLLINGVHFIVSI